MIYDRQIKIDRIVRSNRKTLALIVSRFGELIVRAPAKVTFGTINQFVGKHADWIIKKQEQLINATEPSSEECAYYLGIKYNIQIDKELKVPFKFDRAFCFSEKYAKYKKEILESWFRAQAGKIIKPRFIELAEKHSIKFNSVSITGAKSRWGSCNAKRNINFAYRLVMALPKAIDYVILHELAHLIELNHSANFWSKVEAMMPDYKEQEKYLRLSGHKFHV